jgi:hypothetical protein
MGFLSANFELGTFQINLLPNKVLFISSKLYQVNEPGKWKLRQFVKPQLIIGSKRLNSIGDQLSINDNNGIQGLIVLNMEPKSNNDLQTQAYAPWNLWGFRLNPYFNYSIAHET